MRKSLPYIPVLVALLVELPGEGALLLKKAGVELPGRLDQACEELRLGARDFWGDEIGTVLAASEPLRRIVTGKALDFHPPLYYLVIHFWMRAFGYGEAAVRMPSVLFAVAAVAVLVKLGREVGGTTVSQWAPVLAVFCPAMVMFSRMARYYAMVALLAAVSSLFFWRLLRGPSWKTVLGYAAASLALAYTNYLALCLVAAQLAVGLLRGPRRVLWVVAGAALALGYAPWLGVVLPQAETLAQRGQVANALSGLAGAATRLAYPLYVFALGETVFPWRLHIVAPALVLIGSVTGAGLVRSRRLSLASGMLILLSFGLSWLVVSTVARTVPPAYLPSRMLFLIPVLVVVFALGIRQLGKWGVLAGLATLGVWCYSIGNYYGGNDFHNPVYLIPWRVVVAQLKSSMHAGDEVVATPEYPFLFYKGDEVPVTLLSARTVPAVKGKLQTSRPARVWVLTRERADPTIALALRRFSSWLDRRYEQVETRYYGLEDPRAVELKKALLRRSVSASKVSLTLYVSRLG